MKDDLFIAVLFASAFGIGAATLVIWLLIRAVVPKDASALASRKNAANSAVDRALLNYKNGVSVQTHCPSCNSAIAISAAQTNERESILLKASCSCRFCNGTYKLSKSDA